MRAQRASLKQLDKKTGVSLNKSVEILKKFFAEAGYFTGALRLIFYPITLLITTPIRLAQLIWGARTLFNGDWGNYSAFSAGNGFNNLFYWNRALNIYRYGREGRSPYLGLGEYPMSRGFNYSLPSLYSFWLAPTFTIIVGMFGWLLAHLVWMNQTTPEWLIISLAAAFISPVFYINLGKQNYHAVGWLFFPLFIFGLLNKAWVIAAVGLFLASFGGITFVFIGIIYSGFISLSEQTVWAVVLLIPALLNLLTQVYPLLSGENSSSIIKTMMKAIGLSERKTKYRRTITKRLGIFFYYFLFLYAQFAAVSYYFSGEINFFLTVGIVIFLVNAALFRFADSQTMWMMIMSVSLPVLITNEFNFYVLGSFLLMASPLPVTADFYDGAKIDVVKRLKPFNIAKLFPHLEAFFGQVKKDETVFLCFDDPRDIYEKIFDGYRRLLELPFYFALQSKFLLMPDWWAVFELNYPGAPNLWGRDLDAVKSNINRWQPEFIIVYQESGSVLDAEWEKNEFIVCGELDWGELENDLGYEKFYKPVSPKWWLLRVPYEPQS